MTVQRRIVTTTARLGVALLLGASVLAGCEKKPEPVPEANDETCKEEYRAKLDQSARQQLTSKCLRRSRFKPTPPELQKDEWAW
jgi:entry exclusion lipoprotein TrbK